MAAILKQKYIKPDIIISSKALRAKTTAKIIAEYFNKTIHFNDIIYDATQSELLEFLRKLDDKNETVFLIGHNPSLNALAYNLIDFLENIPTCGVLEIEFVVPTWKDISKINAHFVSFEYPKNIIKQYL